MIWTIARREFLEYMKSMKFLIGFLITLALVVISTVINVADLRQRQQDYIAAQEEMKGDNFYIRVYRPPEALSILVQGKDRQIGNRLEFRVELHKVVEDARRDSRGIDIREQRRIERDNVQPAGRVAVTVADRSAEPLANVFGQLEWLFAARGIVAERLQNSFQLADRHLFAQENLQNLLIFVVLFLCCSLQLAGFRLNAAAESAGDPRAGSGGIRAGAGRSGSGTRSR